MSRGKLAAVMAAALLSLSWYETRVIQAPTIPADYGAGLNTARDMFAIGTLVAKARIADAEAKPDEAIAFLRDAVTKEDQTAYDERSDWFSRYGMFWGHSY